MLRYLAGHPTLRLRTLALPAVCALMHVMSSTEAQHAGLEGTQCQQIEEGEKQHPPCWCNTHLQLAACCQCSAAAGESLAAGRLPACRLPSRATASSASWICCHWIPSQPDCTQAMRAPSGNRLEAAGEQWPWLAACCQCFAAAGEQLEEVQCGLVRILAHQPIIIRVLCSSKC